MRSEDAPRTVGGRFRYRISLPYHRSLFCAPNASGNAPRTTGGRFRYRVPPNEDVPRTVGGGFRYRISLPYRRSLFCAPSASENAPRTTGACFLHRVPQKMRRVPQKPVFRTARIFRTREGPLRYRISLCPHDQSFEFAKTDFLNHICE